MRTLRHDDSGDEVRALQVALNRALRPSPRLVTDGYFDDRTRRALIAFQQDNWLVDDGTAGPATLACLYGLETALPIFHNMPLISQPTPTTCWAASTAMMIGSTVANVLAATPAAMIGADGGLRNASGSDQAVNAGNAYGRIHGLRCSAPMSWTVAMMRAELTLGPIMLDMLWNSRDYAEGRASPGHMIVVKGMRGDSDPSGRGTTMRLNDPMPVNVGERYSIGFARWMRLVPTATYRVFTRIPA